MRRHTIAVASRTSVPAPTLTDAHPLPRPSPRCSRHPSQSWGEAARAHAIGSIGFAASLALWNAARNALPGVPLSRACISLLIRNEGCRVSGTLAAVPFLGLRPGRADQVFTINDPKPRSSTRLRLTNAPSISSNMALTIFSTSLLYRCGFCPATRSTNCDLIMQPSCPAQRSQAPAVIVKRAARLRAPLRA
jgi:hypothetical protein